jgi:hypothetical protein
MDYSEFYHRGVRAVLNPLFNAMCARAVMEQMAFETNTNWVNGHYVLLPEGDRLVIAYNPSRRLAVKAEVATVQTPEGLEAALGRVGAENHVVVPVKPFLPKHKQKLVYRVHPVQYAP